VAMYFLFVSHLIHWLVPPAVLGVIFLMLDLLFSNGSSDNVFVLPLCAGACAWSATFGHFWRRTAAFHALRWGTLHVVKAAEPVRPEFWGDIGVNPVTCRVERHYPWRERIWKVLFSNAVISVCLVALLCSISVLLALRHAFALAGGGRLPFQIINAVLVDIMNGIFRRIAKRLTDLENHRAQSEYTYHLIAKTVVFKFVNCYASLFYIAFFKEHSELFKMPMRCASDDCLSDLASQLAVFLIVRLAMQNFVELVVPYLLVWYRNVVDGHSLHSHSFLKAAAAVDFDLSKAEKEYEREEHNWCEEMDEMLILFGYSSMFLVACPWVPLLALISSLVQCFLDQKKLVLLVRRPFPTLAANNEPWDTAFDIMGGLAVVTNSALTVFATKTFDGWSTRQRVFLFIALEHLAVVLRLVVAAIWPSMPPVVREMKQRQDSIAHRHLELGGADERADIDILAGPLGSDSVPAPFVHDSPTMGEELEPW